MRILSVDDNAQNRYLMEAVMHARGHEVASAGNGLEALEELDRGTFDLIVCDVLMPHMDGFQLCHEVKSRERTRRIPFIFYTATYTARQDEELGLALGASRYILKPVDPQQLITIIEEVLSEVQNDNGSVPEVKLQKTVDFLKAYNTRLVCKLDRKIEQLKTANEDLETALKEKTVLLQEIHHRVMNNLAVIASLLNMTAETTEGAEVKVALEESQQRVRSIGLIHELLYGGAHLDRINFADYAQRLVRVLNSAFVGEPGLVVIRIDAEPIELHERQAVPAALILNELLSNALKHAFPGGRRGEIHVTFRESEPGCLELAVEDDGVGSPDVLVERKTNSLGLQIVRILSAQLAGTLKQKPGSGTRIVLRFPAGVARKASQ